MPSLFFSLHPKPKKFQKQKCKNQAKAIRSRRNLNPKPLKSNFILELQSSIWMLRKEKKKEKMILNPKFFIIWVPNSIISTLLSLLERMGLVAVRCSLQKISQTKLKKAKFLCSVLFLLFSFWVFLETKQGLREKQSEILGYLMLCFFSFFGFSHKPNTG